MKNKLDSVSKFQGVKQSKLLEVGDQLILLTGNNNRRAEMILKHLTFF